MTNRPSLSDQLVLPCGLVLRNRIMKAPLSEMLADNHAPGIHLEQLYARWGKGGYGLVVTGHVMIDRRQIGEVANVVVEDERDLEALTRWASVTKAHGAAVFMQLNHPGRQANPFASLSPPVAPSAVGFTTFRVGWPTPLEVSSRHVPS